MYKILIVDDELIVRNDIKNLIPWNKEGFTIAGEAPNGSLGLEKVQELSPDIILLDIKMPLMDGIEFMRRVKELGLSPKVIILSSYDSFAYASEAIRYGAVCYLLKYTLEPENLLDALKQAVSAIEKERSVHEEITFLKRRVDDLGSLEREALLKEIAKCVSNERFEEIRKTAGLVLQGKSFNVMIAEAAPDPDGLMSSANTMDFSGRNVQEGIRRYLSLAHRGEIFKLSDTALCILTDGFVENSSLCRHRKLVELVAGIYSEIRRAFGGSFTIGIGPEAKSPADIAGCLDKARELLKYRFFCQDKDILYWQNLNDMKRPVDPAVLAQKVGQIEKALKEYDSTGFAQGLKLLLKIVKESCCFESFMYSREKLNLLLNALVQESGEHFPQAREFAAYDTSSIDQVFEEFSAAFSAVLERMKEKRELSNQIVLKAIAYIRNHYHEEITLASVAEAANISRVYLSQLFKQETGENFIDFLTKYRIHKAKDLIRRSDAKIYEVASAVGFEDAKYFSQIFKKVTGLTPHEYKMNSPANYR